MKAHVHTWLATKALTTVCMVAYLLVLRTKDLTIDVVMF